MIIINFFNVTFCSWIAQDSRWRCHPRQVALKAPLAIVSEKEGPWEREKV